jgi:hypothetical protein
MAKSAVSGQHWSLMKRSTGTIGGDLAPPHRSPRVVRVDDVDGNFKPSRLFDLVTVKKWAKK